MQSHPFTSDYSLVVQADIFFGNIYYQRLRHMVSDKFQVRTTGPIDSVTQQPIKVTFQPSFTPYPLTLSHMHDHRAVSAMEAFALVKWSVTLCLHTEHRLSSMTDSCTAPTSPRYPSNSFACFTNTHMRECRLWCVARVAVLLRPRLKH
jgi:hypothetical protein